MPSLTIDYIKKCVAEIEACKSDDEVAHIKEDSLHFEVLNHIATGDLYGRTAKIAATEALKTVNIDFSRYCS